MSFDKLKQSRAAAIDKLLAAAGTENSKVNYGDDRIWAPQVDKAGNGYAVIRFLPAAEGEELPWVRYWDHGFKGSTGRWYIEKSLTTIGQNDPLSELNSKLWNSGREEDKEIARSRKRRLHHVSNILVISDPSNPENEGKVFLYKYGKKIMDKVMDVMQPQFQDEKPVNPFDFWAGANFKLKIRNFEGYRNYDKSEFESVSELHSGDEAKLEDVYNSVHSLKEFTDPSAFKTYAELSKKLHEVLGDEVLADSYQGEVADTPPVAKTAAAPESVSTPEPPFDTQKEDDTETLSYFAKLAQS